MRLLTSGLIFSLCMVVGSGCGREKTKKNSQNSGVTAARSKLPSVKNTLDEEGWKSKVKGLDQTFADVQGKFKINKINSAGGINSFDFPEPQIPSSQPPKSSDYASCETLSTVSSGIDQVIKYLKDDLLSSIESTDFSKISGFSKDTVKDNEAFAYKLELDQAYFKNLLSNLKNSGAALLTSEYSEELDMIEVGDLEDLSNSDLKLSGRIAGGGSDNEVVLYFSGQFIAIDNSQKINVAFDMGAYANSLQKEIKFVFGVATIIPEQGNIKADFSLGLKGGPLPQISFGIDSIFSQNGQPGSLSATMTAAIINNQSLAISGNVKQNGEENRFEQKFETSGVGGYACML